MILELDIFENVGMQGEGQGNIVDPKGINNLIYKLNYINIYLCAWRWRSAQWSVNMQKGDTFQPDIRFLPNYFTNHNLETKMLLYSFPYWARRIPHNITHVCHMQQNNLSTSQFVFYVEHYC